MGTLWPVIIKNKAADNKNKGDHLIYIYVHIGVGDWGWHQYVLFMFHV